MNETTVPLGLRLFAAGLLAGLLAGWCAGCSRSNSAHVDVALVRAALAKRRADYGETPQTPRRPKAITPPQFRR